MHKYWMLLEELIQNREKLLRDAAEEVGYDVPMPKLKWPEATMDYGIKVVNEFPGNAGHIARQLHQLYDAHKRWPTKKTGPSSFWDTSLRDDLEQYEFSKLKPIADKWQAAKHSGITPGPDIRRAAQDCRHVIDYITLLIGVDNNDSKYGEYEVAIARATLKRLGVINAT